MRFALASLLALSGCTTMQNHPYITTGAIVFLSTSLVLCTQHDDARQPNRMRIHDPNCTTPGACQ